MHLLELQTWRVGDRFRREAMPGTPGGCHIIAGAGNKIKSGPAMLASEKFGWSYTGTVIQVMDLHAITRDELYLLMGERPNHFESIARTDLIVNGEKAAPIPDRKGGDLLDQIMKFCRVDQTEIDRVADLIWWHKGYSAQHGPGDIDDQHLKTLRTIRVALMKLNEVAAERGMQE